MINERRYEEFFGVLVEIERIGLLRVTRGMLSFVWRILRVADTKVDTTGVEIVKDIMHCYKVDVISWIVHVNNESMIMVDN